MGFSRSFVAGLLGRLFAVVALGMAFAWSWQQPAMVATTVLLAIALLIIAGDVVRLITHTNEQLARFLGALRHGDFSASFLPTWRAAGFPALSLALDNVMTRLREQVVGLKAESAHLSSLIDHVPIPLLAIDADERVTLLNNAARRVFNRHHGHTLSGFSCYGTALVDALRTASGTLIVVVDAVDEVSTHMRASVSRVARQGQMQRIVSLQPVQADIDAAEIATSRNLVRVLTHEIMNSMTPVQSLAQTAAALSRTLPSDPLNDSIRTATEVVARRTEHLNDFVSRYRDFSAMTTIRKQRFPADEWLQQVAIVFNAEWAQQGVALQVEAPAAAHSIYADRQLLDQVVINLLRNAAQACANTSSPQVILKVSATANGKTLLTVDDNGPGVPADIRGDVFLPFFSTKATGSGVGLSLVRQTVLAHGGSVRIETSDSGGASFRVVI